MNAPRPRPRLAPSGVLRAIRKERISRVGSVISAAGFSRTVRSSSALEAPREWAVMHSTRAASGAFFSCRTSQLTRVVGRPSRGASTSTWQVTGARAQVGGDDEVPDGVGDADGAGELAGAGELLGQGRGAQRGVGQLLAGQDGHDLGAQPSSQAEAGEPQQGVEAGDDSGDALVGGAQGAGGDGVADSRPGLAHVVELEGAAAGVLEVADELAEDPRLVGVGDAAELLLHDGFGQDLGPGQVVQRDLAQLALVDLGGVLAGDGRDLVADRQHGVEALLAGDVEVVLQLLGGQVVAAGLDLDQRRPRPATRARRGSGRPGRPSSRPAGTGTSM